MGQGSQETSNTNRMQDCCVCGRPTPTTTARSACDACDGCRYGRSHQCARRQWARALLAEIVAAADEGLTGQISLDHAICLVHRLAGAGVAEAMRAQIEPDHPELARSLRGT